MFRIDRKGITRRTSLSMVDMERQQQFQEENGKQWFRENHTVNPMLLPGMSAGVEVNEIIAKRKTPFNDLLLINTTAFGKVLAFDGAIFATQKDCFTYYEMCTHLPLCCHPDPKKVLIVGGLDGSGLATEILKHELVDEVVHVEEDVEMVELLKTHFHAPGFAYNNPKFQYFPVDPKIFLKQHPNTFDVIISDCVVPLPQADGLFGDSYFELVKEALKPDGITITQSWGIWIDLRPPKRILLQHMKWLRNLFPSSDYYSLSIPSCTSGLAGNIICSKQPAKSFKNPVRPLSDETIKEWNLGYYNNDVHTGSFALPQFAKELIFPPKQRAASSSN